MNKAKFKMLDEVRVIDLPLNLPKNLCNLNGLEGIITEISEHHEPCTESTTKYTIDITKHIYLAHPLGLKKAWVLEEYLELATTPLVPANPLYSIGQELMLNPRLKLEWEGHIVMIGFKGKVLSIRRRINLEGKATFSYQLDSPMTVSDDPRHMKTSYFDEEDLQPYDGRLDPEPKYQIGQKVKNPLDLSLVDYSLYLEGVPLWGTITAISQGAFKQYLYCVDIVKYYPWIDESLLEAVDYEE